MAGVFKAVIIILVIPAILYLTGVIQDYCDANMSLNTYEQLFVDGLPFILIGLYIIGIFKAISRMRGDD